MKPTPDFLILLNEFNELLQDCRRVYLESAHAVVEHHAHLLDTPADEFVDMMDDLHRGLLIKLFVCIGGAGKHWSESEEHLAGVLFYHLWRRRMRRPEIRDSIRHIENQSEHVKWSSLVRPFAEIEPLRERISELETSVIRIGNLIAKADGNATSLEMEELKQVQQEIIDYLHNRPPKKKSANGQPYQIQIAEDELASVDDLMAGVKDADEAELLRTRTPAEKPDLETSLGKLDRLIGLARVKQEVRTLINFLKVQQHRQAMGLPQTEISLHMVFGGNPGTGKTTVARILGEVYAALGILEKGHLIETDRAGLVAEYAGQTATKTDKIVDQALDGVLFIDEAYSLISADNEDPFGHEAVQKLLKRMEDDRNRLIVILAGYPREMERLLLSNPGLSSRFTHHITFDDFSPLELAEIFELMCKSNQYKMTGLTRARLQMGFQWLHEKRDETFGNGRLVRNLFERAIRRLANRVVDSPKLTRGLLTRFEHEDIQFDEIPGALLEDHLLETTEFATRCPECGIEIEIESKLLGRKVRCKSCRHEFRIGWCPPVHE
ncbi:MAG: AAA family ATPase [Pirellulaceae bacterium]